MLANIYLIALVAGVILLAVSLLGDVFGDLDADADPDEMRFLTLRGVTYFVFVFGAAGVALTRLSGLTATATLAVATAAGLFTATIVGRAFGWLRRTEGGTVESDRTLHGLAAEVIVPLSAQHEGKISVRRGTERLELLARPFDQRDGDPATWRHVVIIDVRAGTALVSPGSFEA